MGNTASDTLAELFQNPDVLQETVKAIRAHCGEIAKAATPEELQAVQERVKATAESNLPEALRQELRQKTEALLPAIASGEITLEEIEAKGANLFHAVEKEVGACAAK